MPLGLPDLQSCHQLVTSNPINTAQLGRSIFCRAVITRHGCQSRSEVRANPKADSSADMYIIEIVCHYMDVMYKVL